jgi:hypothetical protein
MAIGNAYIEIHAITSGFKQEVERALKDLEPMMRDLGEKGGKELGNSLNKGLKRSGGFSSLEQESLAARNAFNKLIRTGYVLGPVISGVVSAVSDLIFGLGAMISAVGAAAPAVAALGGSLAALMQGAITAKLAFGGIGAAVGAINKPQGGGNDNKAIEDARRRLAMTYQRTAETMAAANDKVREAQEALNAAYIKGQESLQQLGFDAEDAAIAQDRAAIQLERTRETLMRMQDLSPDDRARKEAELAFREAELNYRRTTDQVSDLRVQQDYAARTKVEGTQEVIDATNALYEAEADRVKQERDNAQDIAEGQRAVAEALARSASAASAINDAMKDLSPEAQRFAKYIAGLKPVLLELRGAAGRQLFGPLEEAIQNLVDNLVPVLLPILESTGKVLGVIAKAVSNVFTSAKNLDILERVFGGANLIVLENFGIAFANILDAGLKLLDAVSPLTIRFSAWVKTLTASWKMSLNAEGAVGKLTERFNRAGDIAAILGKVLKSTYDGLKEFFGAGTEAGIKLWEAFGKSMDGLKAFSQEGKKTGELQKKFDQIADNVIAIGSALGLVVKGLFELAGNEGVEIFANGIKPAIVALTEMGKILSSPEVAKSMSDLVVGLAELMLKMTETGGIKNFFDILNSAVDMLNNAFSNEIVRQLFTFLAALKGVTLAFGTIKTVSGFFGKALFGNLLVVKDGLVKIKDASKVAGIGLLRFRDGLVSSKAGASAFSTTAVQMGGVLRGVATGDAALLRGSLAGLRVGFVAAGGPVILAVAAIAALVAIFALAYQNSEKLRAEVDKMIKIVKGAFVDAWEDIQEALEDAGISVGSLQDVFKGIGDFLATYFVPYITILFSGIVRFIGGAIAGVIRIVKGVFDYFSGVVSVWKGIFALLTGDFDGFLNHMKDALGKFGSAISGILGGLFQPFKSAWDGIAKAWNSMIGGKSIDTPFGSVKIPYLPVFEKVSYTGPKIRPSSGSGFGRMNAAALMAEGGVVRATPGGVHAIIGEAGRNERVEPLDPSGLSERDKAMIAFMSGGKGTNSTFNIYPSQGMDETELAYVVSRKVAWNMRRGA